MDLLFVVPSHSPFCPHQGAEQRTNLLLRACVNVGNVDVVSFCDDSINNAYGANVIYVNKLSGRKYSLKDKLAILKMLFLSFKPQNLISTDKRKEVIIDVAIKRKHYDYIVIRYPLAAINCGLLKYADRLYIDMDDDFQKSFMMTVGRRIEKRIGFRLLARLAVYNAGKACAKLHNSVFAVTYSNYKSFPERPAAFLPNVPFYEQSSPLLWERIIEGRLLFVGDMKYVPNIQAVNSFLTSIYPDVRRRFPNVSMHIVGTCSVENKEQWEQRPGVKVLGFVDSIEDEYAEANVVVIPMFESAGTCIKFLEAVNMGRPVVTTEVGFNGYEQSFIENKDCFVARTAKEFAEAIISLLSDDDAAFEMAQSAQSKQIKYFSRERFFEVVHSILLDGHSSGWA